MSREVVTLEHTSQRGPAEWIYALMVDDEDVEELPEAVLEEVPGNATKQLLALTLQRIGDVAVDPKAVLVWVLAGLGAPATLNGLLVPVREAGSMLPQPALLPLVRRRARRRWVWVAGATGQAVSVASMAGVAALGRGLAAGVGIVCALAVFAASRALSSVASKDVLGRTIPKGQRGRITGAATTASGLVAISLGLALWSVGDKDTSIALLAALLVGAAVAWVAAAGVFATVTETDGEHDPQAGASAVTAALSLLRDDPPFRRFVVVRALLLVSALSPPFVVMLAAEAGDGGVVGLGAFVVANGAAALIGGRVWGRLADRSSRVTMVAAAAAASGVVVALLLALRIPATAELGLLYPLAHLALGLAHVGARVGRKTYVIDLAEGDRRTSYVATSNAVIAALLLVAGAISSALAAAGPRVALAFLAVLGSAGVAAGLRLPEVSRGRS